MGLIQQLNDIDYVLTDPHILIIEALKDTFKIIMKGKIHRLLKMSNSVFYVFKFTSYFNLIGLLLLKKNPTNLFDVDRTVVRVNYLKCKTKKVIFILINV